MSSKSQHNVSPPHRSFFISCVSHEFAAYRDSLATALAMPGVVIRRQEDFVNTGGTTLEKLDAYIRGCDAVIHIVGDGAGASPNPAQVETLLSVLPDFVTKLGLQSLMEPPGLSYTQWEAWLAIYHGKPLVLFHANEHTRREPGFVREPGTVKRQAIHWKRLKDLGRNRKDFVSGHELCIEVLRALPILVPGFAENIRGGEFRDRNLLFAILALQNGILSRENFIRICTLWGGDTENSIAALMLREGLLSTEDKQLFPQVALTALHRASFTL